MLQLHYWGLLVRTQMHVPTDARAQLSDNGILSASGTGQESNYSSSSWHAGMPDAVQAAMAEEQQHELHGGKQQSPG